MHQSPRLQLSMSFLVLVLRLSMTSITTLSLFLLLSLSSSSATTHNRHRHSPVHQACKATRFREACESTLLNASLPANPTSSDFILAAISASSTNLDTAQTTARAILSASAGNINRTSASKNCVELLSFSSRRLSQAANAIVAGKTDDARAWMSAALLFQYDCFSALKYVNGTKQVDDAMWFLIGLSSLTSNALSLLFSYHRFGDDISLWRPPQTERSGYWGDSRAVNWSSFGGGVPSDLTPDIMVCKDEGERCYGSVQNAVNAAPDFGKRRFVIHIKAGVYDELVRVPIEKTNVVFVGDGMGKTVITGSLNANMFGVSTYNTGTVIVIGDGFMAKDITFENTAGPDQHQAVAFRSDSDLSVIENVEFLGHQDTLYAHSLRQFYKSCRIAGTVDFVFGNSASVFEDCVLLVKPRQQDPEAGETNAVTAQGRTDPAQATGFVFHNCTVSGTEEYMALYRKNPAKHQNYLGRPWKEYSRTVFLNCYLDELVRPEGWLPWSGDFALSTLFYGEFKSLGPGANATGRVIWSNQIPAKHVGIYSVQNFIQGGDWIPAVHSLIV